MASKSGRKYARDNRGRFASVGATARGGRLRTAGGNKRATVTAKAKGGAMAGAIKGKVKRDPSVAGKIGKGKALQTARQDRPRANLGKMPGVVKGSRNLAASSEANRLRKAANEMDRRNDAALNKNGLLMDVTNRMRSKAAKLEQNQRRNNSDLVQQYAKRNRKFETQRAVNTGAFSGQRKAFRSKDAAGSAYQARAARALFAGKTFGEIKRSNSLARKVVGQQLTVFGGQTPIRKNSRRASQFQVGQNVGLTKIKMPKRKRKAT